MAAALAQQLRHGTVFSRVSPASDAGGTAICDVDRPSPSLSFCLAELLSDRHESRHLHCNCSRKEVRVDVCDYVMSDGRAPVLAALRCGYGQVRMRGFRHSNFRGRKQLNTSRRECSGGADALNPRSLGTPLNLVLSVLFFSTGQLWLPACLLYLATAPTTSFKITRWSTFSICVIREYDVSLSSVYLDFAAHIRRISLCSVCQDIGILHTVLAGYARLLHVDTVVRRQASR